MKEAEAAIREERTTVKMSNDFNYWWKRETSKYGQSLKTESRNFIKLLCLVRGEVEV